MRQADGPVIVVECLELGEVAIKRGDVLRPYAPEGTNLEDIACTHSILSEGPAGIAGCVLTRHDEILRTRVPKRYQQPCFCESNLSDAATLMSGAQRGLETGGLTLSFARRELVLWASPEVNACCSSRYPWTSCGGAIVASGNRGLVVRQTLAAEGELELQRDARDARRSKTRQLSSRLFQTRALTRLPTPHCTRHGDHRHRSSQVRGGQPRRMFYQLSIRTGRTQLAMSRLRSWPSSSEMV